MVTRLHPIQFWYKDRIHISTPDTKSLELTRPRPLTEVLSKMMGRPSPPHTAGSHAISFHNKFGKVSSLWNYITFLKLMIKVRNIWL
jgi:hypothetical protein